MPGKASYSIGELAEKAGVTPRTIRYYAAEGLLPPPEMQGRYALYGEEHFLRLRLIARLKAAYLPLGEIRARIEHLTAEQVRQLLAEYGDAPDAVAETASDYIAQVLQIQASPSPSQPAPPAPLGYRAAGASMHADQVQARLSSSITEPQAEAHYGASPPALSHGRIEQAIASAPVLPDGSLEAGSASEQRRTTTGTILEGGETWRRVALAPGVELHLRESPTPASQQRVEQLIAFARELFGDVP